jgi:ATP-dependent DNA helicase RecG
MLPFGFTMDDFKAGVSRVRNRVITRLFHELKFMEQWGSGYRRIIEACLEGGYPEPKWEEFGTYIRVTFYPHPQTLLSAKEQDFPKLESQLSPREKSILSSFDKGEYLPFREIFSNFSTEVSERTLKYNLAQLKIKGYLSSQGKGRATVWTLQ